MEYLMTYGWAILIIAVVLGALFQLGIFNASNFAVKAPPGSCQAYRPNGPGTPVQGLEGECLNDLPEYTASFSSGGGYLSAPLPGTANPSQGTISLWFDRQWSTNDGVTHGLIGLGGYWGIPGKGNADFNKTQIFKYANNNEWYFRVWASPGNGCDVNIADSSIPGNVWHSVVMEWGPAVGGVEVWVDGGTPLSCTQAAMSVQWATNTLYMGFGYGGNPRVGDLANIQVYNTTLSQEEVNAIYTEGIGGAPVRPQNLVGWWPLNGNANDYSGNNNNGAAIFTAVPYTSAWTSAYAGPV